MELLASAKELRKEDKLKLAGLTDSLKSLEGQKVEIYNAVIFRDVDRETGELRDYSAILIKEGEDITAYAGNSAVFRSCVDSLINLKVYDGQDDTITATVKKCKTKAGDKEYIGIVF